MNPAIWIIQLPFAALFTVGVIDADGETDIAAQLAFQRELHTNPITAADSRRLGLRIDLCTTGMNPQRRFAGDGTHGILRVIHPKFDTVTKPPFGTFQISGKKRIILHINLKHQSLRIPADPRRRGAVAIIQNRPAVLRRHFRINPPFQAVFHEAFPIACRHGLYGFRTDNRAFLRRLPPRLACTVVRHKNFAILAANEHIQIAATQTPFLPMRFTCHNSQQKQYRPNRPFHDLFLYIFLLLLYG